jgi:LPS-assembly protein
MLSPSAFVLILTVLIALTVSFFMSDAFADEPVSSDKSVNLEADSMDYDKSGDLYHAKGNAKITYSGAMLSADTMELDNKSNIATAQGKALLQMGDDSLQSDKMVFNIADKTGIAYDARVFYARNHFYINGEEIHKTGDYTYFNKQPVATTCDGDDPAWAITGSEMKVTIEGFGLMKNARFLANGLPVFYTPIFPFPRKPNVNRVFCSRILRIPGIKTAWILKFLISGRFLHRWTRRLSALS